MIDQSQRVPFAKTRISQSSLYWSCVDGQLEIVKRPGIGHLLVAAYAILLLGLCWDDNLGLFAITTPLYIQVLVAYYRRHRTVIQPSGVQIQSFWWRQNIPREEIENISVIRCPVDSIVPASQESLVLLRTKQRPNVKLVSEYTLASADELRDICASAKRIFGIST